MTNFWETVLNFAQTTTTEVGQQLMINWGSVQASEKSDGSLVTQSDHWADQEIRTRIGRTFGDHGILSEEGDHLFPETDWCWIIDPVDGTTNYTRGLPIWGILMGLLYRGSPVFGYVYLPPLNQSFHGFWLQNSGLTGPNGAFSNQHPIRASLDDPSSHHFFNVCSRSTPIIPDIPCKIRLLGMAAYNFLMVASGVAIGGVEATPKVWDLAAVWPIIQAAGAVWTPLNPDPIFPLEPGKNYGDRSIPMLVVSQKKWVSLFQPLVQPLASKR
ncbi:inositol monophosphatase family protein [Capilliphycus salinus ALCB114379]|uniref:inositol monophosphatase family protein n=1 Tax=Capilliphycus salinus TaxID=2768948 RepID=UPI0039A680F9